MRTEKGKLGEVKDIKKQSLKWGSQNRPSKLYRFVKDSTSVDDDSSVRDQDGQYWVDDHVAELEDHWKLELRNTPNTRKEFQKAVSFLLVDLENKHR